MIPSGDANIKLNVADFLPFFLFMDKINALKTFWQGLELISHLFQLLGEKSVGTFILKAW